MTPRRLLAAGAAVFLLAAPAVAVHAAPPVAVTHVDMNHCLRIAARQARMNEARCPGFIVGALADARALCGDARGRLKAYPQTTLWSLDVNADGVPEYLFDVTQNAGCEGAPSALSCGSQICGLGLYAQRNGAWRHIGRFAIEEPSVLELDPASRRHGHAGLRVGCADAECPEVQLYRWNGERYDLAVLEVRGHALDIPASSGQLWTLTRETALLAEPRHGARTLDRYRAGTEVVILGKARAAPYLYVSPCNACAPGFVGAGLLRRAIPR